MAHASALCHQGAQLAGYISSTAKVPSQTLTATKRKKEKLGVDTVPNPEYDNWVAKDQQVFSFLISSIGKEIFAQVSTAQTMAELWAAVEGSFASQSQARVISTRMTHGSRNGVQGGVIHCGVLY